MERQKHLRLSPDERLLLDTLRQYLGAGSESEAAVEGLFRLGEQILASYLAHGIHPQRCLVLQGVLGAAVRQTGEQPRYLVDEARRQLYRWHEPGQQYLPIQPVLGPWLPGAAT